MGLARSYKDKDIKLLWGLAAARCAFPSCRRPLVLEKTEYDPVATIGEMAHIVAHSPAVVAPRSDPQFDDTLRDSYENLILLCDTHHTTVDKQPNTYTADHLRGWKLDHEAWVRESLREQMTHVTFLELEMVAKALLVPGRPAEDGFTVTPPREKMDRNDLRSTRYLVTLGLANARVVEQFVSHFAITQPTFPDELKMGFLAEYTARFAEGLRGDALFQALHAFSSSSSRDFQRQAAGLSVLVYLFEKCEVFQR
jgi:hypothetical protein